MTFPSGRNQKVNIGELMSSICPLNFLILKLQCWHVVLTSEFRIKSVSYTDINCSNYYELKIRFVLSYL